MCLGYLLSQKENCEITLNYFLLYDIFCVHKPFEIWIAVLKRRVILEVIVINWRIILKFILKKEFWNMWTVFLLL